MSKEIKLTKNKFAIVDDDDYESLSQWTWCYDPNGYAHRHETMHRLIMDAQLGFEVDHINRNKLDNRRGNLRLVNTKQNCWNRGPQKETSSKFKGLYWAADRKKWRAELRKGEERIRLGQFDSEVQAAQVYDDAARQLYGDYAYLNFPPQTELPEGKEIKLTRGKITIVDVADFAWLNQLRWNYHPTGNASRSVRMHRVILKAPPDLFVDHINSNRLDNRKSNLRLATRIENRRHSGPQKDNTSGYKGVYWRLDRQQWRASIFLEGKQRHLGFFDAIEDAVKARDEAVRKHHGEFAWLNLT